MNTVPTTPSPAWQRISEPLCALGESPFWHPHEERLYWLDIGQRRIWRQHIPSGQADSWDLQQDPGSIAPCRSGSLLMALRDGIYLAPLWHDTLQKLADAPYDTARIRFNDGKCDPWGRFWVGTYVDTKDQPDGALYCLHRRNQPHPQLLKMAGGVMASNGLAWSPDGRVMYWNDTARNQVEAYPMVSAGQYPPVMGMPLALAHFAPKPEGWRFETAQGRDYGGRPDGAAVDQKGNYWVAMYEGARVLCLSPKGDVLADLATPAQCPTMVCFGGADGRTLYLTTARAKRSAEELAHYPDSGAVFALRVDTPGMPVNFYED